MAFPEFPQLLLFLLLFGGAVLNYVTISVTCACYIGKPLQISRISVWFLHSRIHNVHVCTSSQ